MKKLLFLLLITFFQIDSVGQVISIAAIQSRDKESPFKGRVVSVEGVVTKDLQRATEQKGFYVQSLMADGDSLTSEGLFVFDSLSIFEVEKGDWVRLTGKVDERYGQTIVKDINSLQVLQKNVAMPKPVKIPFPVDTIGVMERYEGMLVEVHDLAVTDVYNLGRYGEVGLSSKIPLWQPTQLIDVNDEVSEDTTYIGKGNLHAVKALQSRNGNGRLLLVDDLSIEHPFPVPFIDSITKTLRIGSTIDTLRGILGFDYGIFRIYPTQAVKIKYQVRPEVPRISGASIKIAAFNVLNFFNGDGNGKGFPTSRGARNIQEFQMQKAKLVAALKGLDADIVGLMEVENDGEGPTSAIQTLLDTLNSSLLEEDKYSFVPEPMGQHGSVGTDEIKVALIYKSRKISLEGPAKARNTPAFASAGRPPLAQTFTTGTEKVTVVVNHFKSKSCTGAKGLDLDQKDGQSCYNETRKKQAQELFLFINDFMKESGDSHLVAIGDFNANKEEDPLDLLRAKGLVDLLDDYSYVFEGQLGALDHAFATPAFAKRAIGVTKWHINSTEPRWLDYTAKKNQLFTPDPFRSSDHDPILIGFSSRPILGGWEKEQSKEEVKPIANPVRRGDILFLPASLYQIEDITGRKIMEFQTFFPASSLNSGCYLVRSAQMGVLKIWVVD